MFAYIDPTIRHRFVTQNKLIRINAYGKRIDVNAPSNDSQLALNILGPIPLPINLNGTETMVQWYAAVRHTELEKVDEMAQTLRKRGDQHLFSVLASYMSVNNVLIYGSPQNSTNPLVRVHSNCLTGDVFGSHRCDCGPQLTAALTQIVGNSEGGILIYMAGHEGRGIGLRAKAVTYLLQDTGENTYQANRLLGLPDDSRDFGDAAALLLYFLDGDRPFRLMSNNPKKFNDLKQHGLTQLKMVKHLAGVGDWNRHYLNAKQNWGHIIEDEDLYPTES